MTENPADRWALPGSVAEPGALGDQPLGAPVPAGAPSRAQASDPARSLRATGLLVEGVNGSDVPQLALRPMTVADILDGAFGIIKARPGRLLGITALFVVPVYLLNAYLQRDALAGFGLWEAFTSQDPEMIEALEDASNPFRDLVSLLLQVLGVGIVLVYVAAGIAFMLGSWSAGQDVPAGRLVGTVARRSWPLLASFLLVHLAEAAGVLACYVGVIFVMPLFVAVAPIIGAEDAGPLDAVTRSTRLAARSYWRVLGITLLIALVGQLLGFALGALPSFLATAIGLDVAWPLAALGSIMGSIVVVPFTAAATVLLYLDLRVRSEGLDLEMSIRDVFSEAGG